MSLKDIICLIFCGILISFQYAFCLGGEVSRWMKRKSGKVIEWVTIAISLVLGFPCAYFWLFDISTPAFIIFFVVVILFFKSSFSNVNEQK